MCQGSWRWRRWRLVSPDPASTCWSSRRRQRHPRRVINELHVNVLVREANAHARTFLRAADLWRIRQRRRRASFCFCSVLIYSLTDLAVSCGKSSAFRTISPSGITGRSCLPCGSPVHPCSGCPCPYKVRAGRSCGIRPPPRQPTAGRVLRWSVWYSLQR